MQILKGIGKGYTVSYILQSASCACVEYNDYPLFDGSIFLDKRKYSLHTLIDCIREEYECVFENNHMEYLIIYTNEKEENLKPYIDYMKRSELLYDFTHILITCE